MRTVLLIPVFNESDRLPGLLGRLAGTADRILFVDDGSRDGCAEVLDRWAEGHPEAEVIHRDGNGGKSRALAEGLRRLAADARLAPADVVVLLDGDDQHPPEAASGLAGALAARNLDLLVACRDLGSYPAYKILGNRVLTWQARLLTGQDWRDTQCGMRALRLGRALEVAEVLQAGGYACEQEMCVALPLRGWRVANDHPILPAHARSNSTFRDAWHIFAAGLRTWSRCRRATRVAAEEPAPSLP